MVLMIEKVNPLRKRRIEDMKKQIKRMQNKILGKQLMCRYCDLKTFDPEKFAICDPLYCNGPFVEHECRTCGALSRVGANCECEVCFNSRDSHDRIMILAKRDEYRIARGYPTTTEVAEKEGENDGS